MLLYYVIPDSKLMQKMSLSSAVRYNLCKRNRSLICVHLTWNSYAVRSPKQLFGLSKHPCSPESPMDTHRVICSGGAKVRGGEGNSPVILFSLHDSLISCQFVTVQFNIRLPSVNQYLAIHHQRPTASLTRCTV